MGPRRTQRLGNTLLPQRPPLPLRLEQVRGRNAQRRHARKGKTVLHRRDDLRGRVSKREDLREGVQGGPKRDNGVKIMGPHSPFGLPALQPSAGLVSHRPPAVPTVAPLNVSITLLLYLILWAMMVVIRVLILNEGDFIMLSLDW